MPVHLFGIRHHGPGSARSVVRALESLNPDIVLIEGPPDAESLIPLAGHVDMKPPVALLIYVPDNPRESVYYPFAEFSPEWQAIRFALSRGIPARFIDLPQSHQLAMEAAERMAQPMTPNTDLPDMPEGFVDAEQLLPQPNDPTTQQPNDAFDLIAQAAGFSDSERWWEKMVEQRGDTENLFAAIHELMSALREQPHPEFEKRDQFREAWMRQHIRAAEKEGFQQIAVVCGAWHTPALSGCCDKSGKFEKSDRSLIKDLPKIKVSATWAPWTYDRLTYWSGYGAGIQSPGYYNHLWNHAGLVSANWFTSCAVLLREQDLDASPATVIDGVRLAEALASLRDMPLPGLPELMESVQATLCGGSETPIALIQRKLIVSDRLGSVPDETPMLPLQQDLIKEQRRLRLTPEASERLLDLDLRKPNEMDRSRLLHRLNLLDIPWGVNEQVSGKSGTFHEVWRLRWEPELAVRVIEASVWGQMVLSAATAYAVSEAREIRELPELTRLVERALFADLPDAIAPLMKRLEDMAGLTSDVPHLMGALPPLAQIVRYGNVRGTDVSLVNHVVDGLVARTCIGLPAACSALNDEAAAQMFDLLVEVNRAVHVLDVPAQREQWTTAVARVADQNGTHGLVAGRCCRVLLDEAMWSANEVARRMGLALSRASLPIQAAAWVEGFLHGSGLLLLHSDALWEILDGWVADLSEEAFNDLLPMVRRTFATFSPPERRQMGERAKHGSTGRAVGIVEDDINHERARIVLPTLAMLLGLPFEDRTPSE